MNFLVIRVQFHNTTTPSVSAGDGSPPAMIVCPFGCRRSGCVTPSSDVNSFTTPAQRDVELRVTVMMADENALSPPTSCMSRDCGWPMGTIQFFDWSRFVDVQQRRVPFVDGR